MKKINWEDPKVMDLSVAETKHGYCEGIYPDDWLHLEGTSAEHPHYS